MNYNLIPHLDRPSGTEPMRPNGKRYRAHHDIYYTVLSEIVKSEDLIKIGQGLRDDL